MFNEMNWQASAQAWFDTLPPLQHAYALVDMASVHQTKRQILNRLKASNATNVLRDNRPDAETASAWLMPLEKTDKGQRDFAASMAWASASACVTWLASSLDHQAMTEALHQRTKAELPDRYAVLLRCHDPRVLPEIHSVLTPEQAQAYWGLDGTWCYVDRQQQFRQIELTATSSTWEPPLKLTQAQTDRLLAAAEVDLVMPELVQESADAFLSIPPTERTAFTKRALAQATAHNLASLADRVMFCILALELGENFTNQTEWQAAMQRVQAKHISLTEAIAQATHA